MSRCSRRLSFEHDEPSWRSRVVTCRQLSLFTARAILSSTGLCGGDSVARWRPGSESPGRRTPPPAKLPIPKARTPQDHENARSSVGQKCLPDHLVIA